MSNGDVLTLALMVEYTAPRRALSRVGLLISSSPTRFPFLATGIPTLRGQQTESHKAQLQSSLSFPSLRRIPASKFDKKRKQYQEKHPSADYVDKGHFIISGNSLCSTPSSSRPAAFLPTRVILSHCSL